MICYFSEVATALDVYALKTSSIPRAEPWVLSENDTTQFIAQISKTTELAAMVPFQDKELAEEFVCQIQLSIGQVVRHYRSALYYESGPVRKSDRV